VWVHRLPSLPAIPAVIKQEQAGLLLTRMGVIYREVVRLHKEKPFDIISSPIWLAEGLIVAMDPRFTSILSLHSSSKTGVDLAGAGLLASDNPATLLEMQCVSAHSYTHANSKAAIRKTTAEYVMPNGAIVIPHGVNDEWSGYVRARSDDDRVRVLIVGLLDKRKGADVLYDIMPKILSRFSTVDFMLVGPACPLAELNDDTLSSAMKRRFVSRPDILQRVTFAGVVSDHELYQHYANADFLLLASRYESFGLSVIEAMSFSLPVVAWKAGGVCETLVDGETGILIDVEDRDGLIEAVGRLATDPDLRRIYGEKGRERYVSKFSTATSIPRTIAVYRQTVAASNASTERRHQFEPEALVSCFVRVIEGVTALRGESAEHTARSLIDGDGADLPVEVAPPRVGIVVRCSDSAGNVAAALDSVLAQAYRNFHCVVVDDASEDNSAEVIAGWMAERNDDRFSFVRSGPNRGQMASIASGLSACDGELVAFLDADDLWSPHFLQVHVSVIHGTPISMSLSHAVEVDGNGKMPRETSYDGLPRVRLEPASYLNPPGNLASCMMYRRSILDVAMPHDLGGLRDCALEYMHILCRLFSGLFVIDQSLTAVRGQREGRRPPLVVLGPDIVAGSKSERCDGVIVARALLSHLLDNSPKLRSVLPPRSRQILVRRLVRRCLLAGVSLDDPRINHVVGSSRILRDKLRAKVWFLRRGLI
jgi:glycosyltransferase involved in cell wall biosynthesis